MEKTADVVWESTFEHVFSHLACDGDSGFWAMGIRSVIRFTSDWELQGQPIDLEQRTWPVALFSDGKRFIAKRDGQLTFGTIGDEDKIDTVDVDIDCSHLRRMGLDEASGRLLYFAKPEPTVGVWTFGKTEPTKEWLLSSTSWQTIAAELDDLGWGSASTALSHSVALGDLENNFRLVDYGSVRAEWIPHWDMVDESEFVRITETEHGFVHERATVPARSNEIATTSDGTLVGIRQWKGESLIFKRVE